MKLNFKHIVSSLEQNPSAFETIALSVFEYQYTHNAIYQKYCTLLNKTPQTVNKLKQIPFIPIEFFKNHDVVCGKLNGKETVFTSSGTTGSSTSKHYVKDLSTYTSSYELAFEQFIGQAKDLCIFALLPAYLERTGSSLIQMVNGLIKQSAYPQSGFYLNNYHDLQQHLIRNKENKIPTLLIGVSFALLDMAEGYPINFPALKLMETGGMKGRRKELIRYELHKILSKGFGVTQVCSEYGMTELLSQAYSLGNGIFECPNFMKVMVRDVYDPFCYVAKGKTGALNIIDLANIDSCSFIQTQDLGKMHPNGFEVLGRTDSSDVRGCNLMVF